MNRQTPKEKARQRAYNHTPKRKAYLKTYFQTPKAKALKKARLKKWRESPKGKAWNKIYSQNPKRKASIHAYDHSPKGKATKKALRETPKAKAKKKACDKIWRESSEGKAWLKKWERERWINQPNILFAVRSRARIKVIFKKQGLVKSAKTEELLGCSIKQAYEHFKSTFKDGMTEDLFLTTGKIHIDHIRPCVSFDLTDPEQQKQCFHYTNLQALWAFDNLSKGGTHVIPTPERTKGSQS